jgi:myo-inositol-hexaphosphate 3-phosphohydrolase
MQILSLSRRAVVGLILLGVAMGANAEKNSLTATIPYQGEGRVFQVAPDTMLFMADFEGIMYVETAEGEMDQAFVRCPAIQKLNVKTKASSGHGYCVIAVSEGNTVYAEWTCEGNATGCRGEFTLTAGTGKFDGIKGSSELLVRSPLHALLADMASGSIVTAEAGLVVLPKLTYEIPNR